MTDSTESSTTEVPFSRNNGMTSSGELQNIQAAYRLNGRNYLEWSQSIRTFLKGKGKLTHLLGTKPKKDDPTYAAWDEENSLVMSWFWNSMLPEINNPMMFLSTAKEIWDAVKLTYSEVHDAAQIYKIVRISVNHRVCQPLANFVARVESLSKYSNEV